jgi:hypothetical protein
MIDHTGIGVADVVRAFECSLCNGSEKVTVETK